MMKRINNKTKQNDLDVKLSRDCNQVVSVYWSFCRRCQIFAKILYVFLCLISFIKFFFFDFRLELHLYLSDFTCSFQFNRKLNFAQMSVMTLLHSHDKTTLTPQGWLLNSTGGWTAVLSISGWLSLFRTETPRTTRKSWSPAVGFLSHSIGVDQMNMVHVTKRFDL